MLSTVLRSDVMHTARFGPDDKPVSPISLATDDESTTLLGVSTGFLVAFSDGLS
ncbi:hypothetical protein JG688_00017325 [Phytophthora aleatoria]|uniref:PPM-type phosphatase domain-containing protein n=1 Tax=Phytophthora aleatoria TaxID=2496075 RepID=A0A8J5ISR4_9STRA|nr:hypothetical protein JG688_00017325 [Phytophthora aleatoria]